MLSGVVRNISNYSYDGVHGTSIFRNDMLCFPDTYDGERDSRDQAISPRQVLI